MRGVNKAILVGCLGADPDVKYMPSGGAVTTVSVATSEQWKDKNTGQPQERTEWHRLVFYNRLAEVAGEYLKKGSKVYVEGKLRTRKWQAQDGSDRYTTEVIVDEMQMLDGVSKNGVPQTASQPGFNQEPPHQGQHYEPQQHTQNAYAQQKGGTTQRHAPPQHQPAAGFDDFNDDILF